MINEKVINGATINGSPNYRYRFAPSVDDVVSVVDGEVQRQFNVTMTGALDVLESITSGTVYTQTREDFITVGDEVLRSLLRGVVVLDVVLLTDDFVRVLVRGRTLVELLTLTDPTSSAREVGVTVSEDIDVTDQTIRSILFQRVSSDGLTLLDFIIGDAANVTNVTVSEFIALVDEALRSIERNRLIFDDIEVTDETLRILLFQRVSSDGLTLLDFIIGGSSGVTSVTLSEFVAFADEVLRSIERGRTLTDTATFSDELPLSIERLATLIESVTIQDGNLNIFLRNSRITEGVTVTDELLTSLLFAILYNVRVFLGRAVDVRLSYNHPVALSWVRGPELGAYA
jgi:hypothetical protein